MKALARLLFLALSAPLFAQTTVSGSGGSFVSPTTVGSNITISNVTMADGRLADLSCPVTFFGAGPYQWNWTCANGQVKFYSEGQPVEGISIEAGTVTLRCSGGGRTHPTTCVHTFSGHTTNPDTGAMLATFAASATGGPNNATGKVTAFSVTLY